MCGIVGAVGGRENDLEAALELIKRRGPDDTSVSSFGDVVFGHNRLAIIDLDPTANQPMKSSCGQFVTIFNGEIYNYKDIKAKIGYEYDWQTKSDTEVILAAYKKWGAGCVHHFKGMFAFVVWDLKEKKMFGARDRLGVKPFYYRQMGHHFYFGSRPDAVVRASGQNEINIDPQAVRLFLEAGYVPAPLSIYQELKKLAPGHSFYFSKDQLTIQPYWSVDKIETDSSLENKSEEELLKELEALISDSVRLRMVSDVPVGVFLSGGIDSSLVAALMARLSSKPIRSFSIGFKDPDFDESVHASAVAEHLKTDHLLAKFDVDDLLQFMPDFLSQYDEPFFDYSAFPVMAVSKMARQHVKVSLSGDGGDEAFGGYHYYNLMRYVDLIQKFPHALRLAASWLLALIPLHKARLFSSLLKVQGRAESFAFLRSVIKDHKSIISPTLKSKTYGLDRLFKNKSESFPKNLTGAELGMRLDTSYTLPDDYLQKVDVGSMAFSLEARDPLLDYRIFEWAAKLPLKWKIRATNKYLLRQLAYKYVPKEILDRPKMGFGVPMASWLRGPLKPWAEPLIQDQKSLELLGLVPVEVQKLWQRHQNNEVQAHTILWAVLVLLAFQKERPWLRG